MRTHLSHKHKSLNLDSCQKSNSQLSLASCVKAQATLKQSWGPLQKKDLHKAKSDEITKNMTLMCALDLRPMSLVEGLGLKTLMYCIISGYVVPTSNTKYSKRFTQNIC